MKVKNYKNISWAYIINSGNIWKTVTIFWWIHWDEVSWIKATKQFINEVNNENIIINNWKIIIVTECNEKAIIMNKREVKYNLNRLFFKWNKWNSYEVKRSNELMNILDKSDYLLDLHSTSEASIPFSFAEEDTLDFAKTLWISHIVTWWKNLEDSIWGSTEEYIDSIWWKWYTYEAWSHLDIDWARNAYKILLNFLSSLWIIDKKYFTKSDDINIFNIEEVYINKSWKFKYSIDNLSNFSEIKKWACIWLDWDEKIIVNEDKILFMPKTESIIKKWEEVFFYVTKI